MVCFHQVSTRGFNPARFPVEIPPWNILGKLGNMAACVHLVGEATIGKSLFKKNTHKSLDTCFCCFNARHDLIYHDITNSSNLFLAWDHRLCNHCWLALSRWRPPPGSQCLGVVTNGLFAKESFKRLPKQTSHLKTSRKSKEVRCCFQIRIQSYRKNWWFWLDGSWRLLFPDVSWYIWFRSWFLKLAAQLLMQSGISWVWPPSQDASDHQDCYIF